MIFLVYSLILGFIIPFIIFLLPYILYIFIDINSFPVDIAINIILPFFISLVFFFYHRQNTQIACETSNNQKALVNGLYVMIVMIVWMMMLDYFPNIISPFLQIFSSEHPALIFISKFIMIYGVVFILLTYTSFNSINETCKININQIKAIYKKMEKALK